MLFSRLQKFRPILVFDNNEALIQRLKVLKTVKCTPELHVTKSLVKYPVAYFHFILLIFNLIFII